MCAYKLVDIDISLPGSFMETKAIALAREVIRGTFLKTHAQTYCWIDQWFDLSLDEVKRTDDLLCKAIKAKAQEVSFEDNEGGTCSLL